MLASLISYSESLTISCIHSLSTLALKSLRIIFISWLFVCFIVICSCLRIVLPLRLSCRKLLLILTNIILSKIVMNPVIACTTLWPHRYYLFMYLQNNSCDVCLLYNNLNFALQYVNLKLFYFFNDVSSFSRLTHASYIPCFLPRSLLLKLFFVRGIIRTLSSFKVYPELRAVVFDMLSIVISWGEFEPSSFLLLYQLYIQPLLTWRNSLWPPILDQMLRVVLWTIFASPLSLRDLTGMGGFTGSSASAGIALCILKALESSHQPQGDASPREVNCSREIVQFPVCHKINNLTCFLMKLVGETYAEDSR